MSGAFENWKRQGQTRLSSLQRKHGLGQLLVSRDAGQVISVVVAALEKDIAVALGSQGHVRMSQ